MQITISFPFLVYRCFILTCLKFSFKVSGNVGEWMASKRMFSAPALAAGYRDELNELDSHQFLILRSSLPSRETQ